MSSIEEDDLCSKECGRMVLDWLEVMIQTVGWSLQRGTEDAVLDKLNDVSLVNNMPGEKVIDGLIAFGMNAKWNHGKGIVTLNLIEDYDFHLSVQAQKSMNLPVERSAKSKPNAKRSVLRELSQLSQTYTAGLLNDEDELMEGGDDHYYHDDDEDIAMDMSSSTIDVKKDVSVKSTYEGSRFKPVEDSSYSASVNILSSCKQEDYGYGSDGIHEELEDLIYVDREEDDENSGEVRLAGAVYPSGDGRALTWDTCVLHSLQHGRKRVRLNFDSATGRMALFPGKKLIVSGTPSGANQFNVSTVSELPAGRMAGVGLESKHPSLRLLIACGPFSLSKDASVDQTFKKLLDQALALRGNVLIIVGPFIPTSAVQQERPADDLLEDYFQALDRVFRNTSVRILIVPNSSMDLCAVPQFPTPPYVPQQSYQNITFLPDPAIFEVEGVRLAVTSSEILFHLSRREIYRSGNAENEDRMRRLISHVFRSQSLYPLQPSDDGMCFSLKGSYNKLELHERPHLLVVPSVLQPSVKIVDRCMVVNPGRLVKGTSTASGSFACVEVNFEAIALSAGVDERTARKGDQVANCSRVELVSLK